MTTKLFELSSAIETDFDCGIHGLRPFQHVAVEYAKEAKRIIIGDTMGLGKTVEALVIAEYLDLYPLLVICPANLRENWKKEVNKWLPHRSIEVLGLEQPKYTSDIIIINYDILSNGWQHDQELANEQLLFSEARKKGDPIHTHFNRIRELKEKVKKDKKYGKFQPSVHTQNLARIDLKAVVMDEGHKVKEKSAQRSRATYYLSAGTPGGRAAGSLARRKGVEYRLWMTGTPVLSKPKELIYPLQILGWLKAFGGYDYFTKHFCDRKQTKYGIDINGSSNEQELNNLLRSTCYIRRTTKDVLEQMPPLTFSDHHVEIDNREEYNYAEQELIEYVGERARNNPEFLEEIAHLEEKDIEKAIQSEENRAKFKAEIAETLVRIGNLRRLTAEGKLQSSINWIEEFLENGESVLVFANHRHVVSEIAKKFKAPKIMGGMTSRVIERGKEAFQSGEEQMMVLNIQAGGEGHTLTKAHHIIFVEYPWTPAEIDQAIMRAYARMNDIHGVTVYNLIAISTMDDILISIINNKRKVVDAITDGKEKEQVEGFMQRLIRERG